MMSSGAGPCLGGGLLLGLDSKPALSGETCRFPGGPNADPCDASPGGPSPPRQPSGGQAIVVDGCENQYGGSVGLLTVTCAETGISLVSSCGSLLIFYLYPVIGSPPFNFYSPGGIGYLCEHENHNYTANPEAIRYGYQMPFLRGKQIPE